MACKISVKNNMLTNDKAPLGCPGAQWERNMIKVNRTKWIKQLYEQLKR